MHLGFLTPEYPHARTGAAAGIGTSIKNMAEAMAGEGVKISIFVYGQNEDAVFWEKGIKFHLIAQRKFRFLGWYLYRRLLQHYLNKFIALDKINAVEAPDWTGITAFIKISCPLVIRMNGSDAYFCHLENRPQKKKNFWFEQKALKGADHLLSVSKFTAEKTAKIFDVKKEIRIIPNSVNTSFFKPQKAEIKTNQILYFGSIIRKKGLLELAEIFNLIVVKRPEAELVIAGKDVIDRKTGKSTKELMLKLLSSEASKKVNFTGPLPYKKILDQIATAKVVVLPSFAEALPMTWLEAMAMEKALVTSDIGWAKEVMVNGETGFTADPTEHAKFAKHILTILSNEKLACEMGKAARERVKEHFSTGVVTSRNLDFYNAITGN